MYGYVELSTVAISIAASLAFFMSFFLTLVFSNPLSNFQIIDYPNERSLHSTPVPRTGGLAMCSAIFIVMPIIAVVLKADTSLIAILIGTLVVSAISFLDDRFTLNASIRLLVHVGVAALLLIAGYSLSVFEMPLWPWEWPVAVGAGFSLLYIVWLINLYNFMDGMDGFAGGMAVIGFVTFAILGFQADETLYATLCLVIAASALGFLIFNFPPAKIFMGDVGSSTLGFLVAVFSLWASRDGIFPLWIAVLIFSPFIVDATLTLFRRLIKGEKIWEAHRSHYYQRLVQLGWGHRRTVLWEYLLMVLCGVSAIVATKINGHLQWALLIIWVMIYSILVFYINKLEFRHKNCDHIATKS